MPDLIRSFEEPFVDADGNNYIAQVWAEPLDTRWHAWLVFVGSDGIVRATGRETVQATAAAIRYWAAGLTRVYLEGAVKRAVPVDVSAPDLARPA
jgi:hypothetical protein